MKSFKRYLSEAKPLGNTELRVQAERPGKGLSRPKEWSVVRVKVGSTKRSDEEVLRKGFNSTLTARVFAKKIAAKTGETLAKTVIFEAVSGPTKTSFLTTAQVGPSFMVFRVLSGKIFRSDADVERLPGVFKSRRAANKVAKELAIKTGESFKPDRGIR